MKLEKEVEICGITTYRGSENRIEFVCNINDNNNNVEVKLLKMQRKKNVKLTLEIQEPILDDEEKRYLSGVIRPFRDRVKCIKKEKDSNKREYITIVYDDGWLIPLPFFENNIMYKNLELGKEYKLEDLRL